MRLKTLLLTAAAAVLCSVSMAVWSATMRVIVVETDNVERYATEVKRGMGILKKIGSTGEVRILRSTFAGPETGTIVVVVEYESLAAMGQDEAKIMGSAEYQTWLAGLSMIRKIVSDSIYQEL